MPVLYLRDENGNFVPIPAIRGANGKSAYEQAKEGGFKGTEEEFIAVLNGLTSSEAGEHYSDFDNPHNVTKEQLGLGNVTNDIAAVQTELTSHIDDSTKHIVIDATGAIIIGDEASNAAGDYGIAIGEGAETRYGGVAIGKGTYSHSGSVAVGESARTGGNDSISIGKSSSGSGGVAIGTETYAFSGDIAIGKSAKVQRPASEGSAVQIGAGTNQNGGTLQVFSYQLLNALGIIPSERLPIRIASGSYKGTNVNGISKPNTLTFDFVPKLVIVSQRGERNATGGGCFIWISEGSTLNFINNGSTYWVHPTLNDKTLSWYCAESASYQLNSSNYTYDYFAWGIEE